MEIQDVSETPVHKALYKEMDELHSYARVHIHQFMAWFSFFSTINILALGWLATATPKPLIRECIAINFLAQSILAVMACRAVDEAFEKSGHRVQWILERIDQSNLTRSPLPNSLYKKSVTMVAGACLILSILWMIILASMLTGLL